MVLDVKYREIIGKIDNLEEKLNGELPIDKLELLYLINSWGRNQDFFTIEGICIEKCPIKECYDLSKLDTSKINNMSSLFRFSNFEGDISNWNTSNVTNMRSLFYGANKFNSNIGNWNVSNVTNMKGLFFKNKSFNKNINSWDTSNVVDMSGMFFEASNFNQTLTWSFKNVLNSNLMFDKSIAFEKKFNNGNPLPQMTNEIKEWFKENRDMMLAIDIKEREKDNLDSFYNNLESLYNNLDKENN